MSQQRLSTHATPASQPVIRPVMGDDIEPTPASGRSLDILVAPLGAATLAPVIAAALKGDAAPDSRSRFIAQVAAANPRGVSDLRGDVLDRAAVSASLAAAEAFTMGDGSAFDAAAAAYADIPGGRARGAEGGAVVDAAARLMATDETPSEEDRAALRSAAAAFGLAGRPRPERLLDLR